MSDVGERELLAIIFTDAVDSTARTASDEDYSLRILLADLDYMRNEAAVRGGTVLKNTGDGLLISFKSAVDAVECALSIQSGFSERAEKSAFQHKIGVHIGDVIKKDGDIYGSGVNTAARLVAQCPSGGLCISSTLYELVKQKSQIGNLNLQSFLLKNIEPPIKAYQITKINQNQGESIQEKQRCIAKKRNPFAIKISAFLVSLGIVLFFGYKYLQEYSLKNLKTISAQQNEKIEEQKRIKINNDDEIIGEWKYQGGSTLIINPNFTALQTWNEGGAAGKVEKTGEREYIISFKSGINTWNENIKISEDSLSFKGLNNYGEFVFAKKLNNKKEISEQKNIIYLSGIWESKDDAKKNPSSNKYYIKQVDNSIIIYAEEKGQDPEYSFVIVGVINDEHIHGTLYDLPKGKRSSSCKILADILSPNEIRLKVVNSSFEWSIMRDSIAP